MFKSMTPPISYYGGKQRMAHNIVPLIPKHLVYVEPFCGGATILFKKPWPNVSNSHHYREVINDHDNRLINFYKVLQDKTKAEELCNRLSLSLYSEMVHEESKDLLSGSDIDQAYAYYCNVRMSFSNNLSKGWGRGVWGTNLAATWMNKVANLSSYIERMASVSVTCQDALKTIQQWDSPQTFFYVDPPYPGTDQGHYSGYTTEHFRELIELLKTIKGSFILSNYGSDPVPKDWERFEFSANCSGSSKGKVGKDRDRSKKATDLGDRKRTEIVWRKFSQIPRQEVIDLYMSGKFDCFCPHPWENF